MIATEHYATFESPVTSCIRYLQHLAETRHRNILVRAHTLAIPTPKVLMKPKRKSPEKSAIDAAVLELLTGKAFIATAKAHGLDPTTLRRHAIKKGWKGTQAQYSCEYKREIMDSIAAGESVMECAARTGIPAKTVYQWLNKAGYTSKPQYIAPEKEPS